MSNKIVKLLPVDYQDAISGDLVRQSEAQVRMGNQLERYGFGIWTNTGSDKLPLEWLYKAGEECLERWDEIMSRCSRSNLGMLGPTGVNEEQHPDSEPEFKMFIALDEKAKGWPSFIPGARAVREVFSSLYGIGVETIKSLERHRCQPEGYLSDHLSRSLENSHTSARLNLYPKNKGFSAAHEDTAVVSSLLWRPGLQIKQGKDYVDLEGASDGDVVVNIGASGSKFLTRDFHLSTWHRVRKMEEDRISFVVFLHANDEVCFPYTEEKVYDWCTERFMSRGGTEDRNPSSKY